jgi:hypothetical protein
VIDKDTVLHFKPIKIGENTGDKVTILEGINEGERVALNVGESILDRTESKIGAIDKRKLEMRGRLLVFLCIVMVAPRVDSAGLCPCAHAR